MTMWVKSLGKPGRTIKLFRYPIVALSRYLKFWTHRRNRCSASDNNILSRWYHCCEPRIRPLQDNKLCFPRACAQTLPTYIVFVTLNRNKCDSSLLVVKCISGFKPHLSCQNLALGETRTRPRKWLTVTGNFYAPSSGTQEVQNIFVRLKKHGRNQEQ